MHIGYACFVPVRTGGMLRFAMPEGMFIGLGWELGARGWVGGRFGY